MIFSGFKQSISPDTAAHNRGILIGPGGAKCPCCAGPILRSARRKENKSRTHKRLDFTRTPKRFWFED